jgi:hypothetical protein
MPSVSYEERKRVNHELKKLGFGGLEDRTLVAQIAFCIAGHDQFRGMLLSVMPDKRKFAYETLRPHLRFTPKPLDVYEAEGKRLAEEKQLPTWDGSAYPKPYKPGEVESPEYRLKKVAEKALSKGVLTIQCKRCLVQEEFPALKRNDALYDAYKAGWRWDEGEHYCPAHVPDHLRNITDLIK